MADNTARRMEIMSDLPEDLQRVIDELRGPGETDD